MAKLNRPAECATAPRVHKLASAQKPAQNRKRFRSPILAPQASRRPGGNTGMNALDAPAPTPSAIGPLLRTLVLCDLVNSTALVERLGDQHAAALLRRHDRLARDLVLRHVVGVVLPHHHV